MSDQFDWQFVEDQNADLSDTARSPQRIGLFRFWLFTFLIVISVACGWVTYKQRVDRENAALITRTQHVLDLQRQALFAGDGDLFFTLQADDPQWFSAQLLPENQDIIRAGLTVTNAEEHGENVWANVTWEGEKEEQQRILFFESRAGNLRGIASDPRYWGNLLIEEFEWGTLKYYAADDLWADNIGRLIGAFIDDVCRESCRADQLPLTVTVRDDYRETAEPGQIHIPSPRLLGLDKNGQPSSTFWRELDRRVSNRLSPATIRFAVAPSDTRGADQWLINYTNLADVFMAAHPHITVEIIILEVLPEDLSTLALEYDGAAFTPTEEMLAAGLVRDLDDYISSDPDFDRRDFYDQIWQGAGWRERTWFMPQAAEMPIIFYDKEAYHQAEHPDPSSRWTWEEMAQDVSTIVADQPRKNTLVWGFLDVGLNALYSYAYNWNNQCTEAATIFCQTPLLDQNIAAALNWYYQMTKQPGQMPDLVNRLSETFSPRQMMSLETMLTDDPQTLLLNLQGSGRKAAVWVDSPTNYEFNLLLSPVGVVSFPGSDRFDGITPLWLHGSFISQKSDHPLAVWEWLKFLSYQSPTPRFIPGRPSVAAESGYWKFLPRPLGDVMRTAFPFARPVTISEQKMITWEKVADVLIEELTPTEAASKHAPLLWFGE